MEDLNSEDGEQSVRVESPRESLILLILIYLTLGVMVWLYLTDVEYSTSLPFIVFMALVALTESYGHIIFFWKMPQWMKLSSRRLAVKLWFRDPFEIDVSDICAVRLLRLPRKGRAFDIEITIRSSATKSIYVGKREYKGLELFMRALKEGNPSCNIDVSLL